MNWPSAFEFTAILFLVLFLSWIKAVLCIAVAIFIRPLWISLAVAALIGVGETAVDMGLELFFAGMTDIYSVLFLLLPASAGMAWWCIGRAVYAMASYGYRRAA